MCGSVRTDVVFFDVIHLQFRCNSKLYKAEFLGNSFFMFS